MKRVVIACAALLMAFVPVQKADWKYVGDSDIQSGMSHTLTHNFILMSEMNRHSNDHVEVWMKAVDAEGMKGWKASREQIEAVVALTDKQYEPPYSKIANISGDQWEAIITLEQEADSGQPDAMVKMLKEIDCKGKTQRTLSLVVPGIPNLKKPTDWEHITPESIHDNVMHIVC